MDNKNIPRSKLMLIQTKFTPIIKNYPQFNYNNSAKRANLLKPN